MNKINLKMQKILFMVQILKEKTNQKQDFQQKKQKKLIS